MTRRPVSESNGRATIDQLWLDTLQRITSRLSHELKGALNGVSVNLEVVRSRAEKPDAAASAVRQYAETATAQLGAVITMTEALLSLSRSARDPVDVGALVRRFAAIVAPAAQAEGRSFSIGEPIDDIGATGAGANAVRLAVGASLLRATAEASRVSCRGENGGGPRLYLDAPDGESLTRDEAVAAAVEGAGIRIQSSGTRIAIVFPGV